MFRWMLNVRQINQIICGIEMKFFHQRIIMHSGWPRNFWTNGYFSNLHISLFIFKLHKQKEKRVKHNINSVLIPN